MKNRYRLSSDAFKREDEDKKINPKKVFFLAVEGNNTEKEYFQGISSNRDKLGIDAIVDVEVLDRSSRDNNSAPEQVIELLEEYIRLRENSSKSLIEDIPKEFIQQYGIDFIEKFLKDESGITKKQKSDFITQLSKIGYNIQYRKYLKKYDNEFDEFCILIDRDTNTHSEKNMIDCIEYCKEKKYSCYICNPLFEFWLLLHLSDVKEEYSDKLSEIKENKKVSNNHTFVSREVSQKAHHGKSGINFKKNYMPYVDIAIKRAKKFPSDENELIYDIGCNIWKLLESMKNYKE